MQNIKQVKRDSLLSDTFTVGFFSFSSKLDDSYRDNLIPLSALVEVWFAYLIVWSAKFIAELF